MGAPPCVECLVKTCVPVNQDSLPVAPSQADEAAAKAKESSDEAIDVFPFEGTIFRWFLKILQLDHGKIETRND